MRLLGLVGDRGVVQLQFVEGVAQVREIVAVDRVDAAKNHGLGIEIPLKRRVRRMRGLGDGLSRARAPDVANARNDETHFARTEHVDLQHLGGANADFFELVVRAGAHHANSGVVVKGPLHDAHGTNDATKLVVVGVEDERLQRCRRVAGRRGYAHDDGVEQRRDTLAGLGRDRQHLVSRDTEYAFELVLTALGVGRGQVDLVENGHDLEVVLKGLVTVGQRLGLNALAGVDEEHRSLAGRQRARDLVAEVHVAGSVDELDQVALVLHSDVLSLDGDAALTLDIHRVEILRAHETRINGPGDLQDPIRERGLAVVDVRNDAQIADFRGIDGGW